MTVNDVATFCTQTVGDISSDAVAFAKTAIRLKYKTLYDSHAWRESQCGSSISRSIRHLNGVFFLPYDAEELIFCKMARDGINYTRLNYRDRDWIERIWATTALLASRAISRSLSVGESGVAVSRSWAIDFYDYRPEPVQRSSSRAKILTATL